MSLPRRLFEAARKRLPPHGRDRALEFLLPRRRFERLRLPQASAITVICDDGAAKDLDVLEVLDKHGVKGVIAACPELVGRPGYLSYEQLRQVQAAGHEIAFHGTTDTPLPTHGNAGQLLSALKAGLAQFAAQGLDAPRTLVYPAGRNNVWVRAAAAELFDCAFTTWYGINRGLANRYAIRRVALGAFTPKHATESWYRDLIDQAAAGHCWPTLMLHPGEDAHQRAHDALLSRLLDHARARNIPVRTAAAHVAAAGAGEAA